MHFMNPPPIMKLVEIVRGAETSDETFNLTKALAERLLTQIPHTTRNKEETSCSLLISVKIFSF